MVKDLAEGSGEAKLENWISYILIAGVLVSLALETVGIILFYRLYHSVSISHGAEMFVRGQDFFTFLVRLLYEMPTDITAFRLMTLGIAILILTPYLRAVMSVVYFARQRNLKYLFITLFVLVILTASLMRH